MGPHIDTLQECVCVCVCCVCVCTCMCVGMGVGVPANQMPMVIYWSIYHQEKKKH